MAKGRENQVRVIAGEYRGRRLTYPAGRILRPTMQKTREALFSSIQGHVEGSGFVDLFCGAGGVGIEALSRGAAFVEFVEHQHVVLDCLRGNLDALAIPSDRYAVRATDAFRYLQSDTPSDPRTKIIFADPPYDTNYAARLLENLREKAYDNLELVIIEHREALDPGPIGRLQYSRTKRFGESHMSFWKL